MKFVRKFHELLPETWQNSTRPKIRMIRSLAHLSSFNLGSNRLTGRALVQLPEIFGAARGLGGDKGFGLGAGGRAE